MICTLHALAADTAVSVLVCTYAGCCAVPVTWQDMAAKVRRSRALLPALAIGAYALQGCVRRARGPVPCAAACAARKPGHARLAFAGCRRCALMDAPAPRPRCSILCQAVPTALGGVWGLIVTLTLPNFARQGSGRTLGASCLRPMCGLAPLGSPLFCGHGRGKHQPCQNACLLLCPSPPAAATSCWRSRAPSCAPAPTACTACSVSTVPRRWSGAPPTSAPSWPSWLLLPTGSQQWEPQLASTLWIPE